MPKRASMLAAIVLMAAGLKGVALAQQTDKGKLAYQWHCAPCHGLDGKGDGLPSDLTALAKRNDGRFPYKRIFEIVESTWMGTNVARRMPIMDFDARTRSAAIVDYLRRIQEK